MTLVTRRDFLGRSTAGISSLTLSPALLELLMSTAGCSRRPAPALLDLIVPEEVLNKAVALLMAKGASFADVFIERAAFDSVSSDDKKINTSTVVEKGVGLRAVKDGKTFYAYTSSFEPEQIYSTARYVAAAASRRSPPSVYLW